MKKYLLYVLFLVFAISNCQTTTIHFEDTTGIPATQANHKKKYSTTAMGYYDITKNYDSPCAQLNQVVIKRDYLDIAIFIAVNPFYSPRTIELHCK